MDNRPAPTSYKGLQVAVVGLGKSNQALCRYLAIEGACLTCFDKKTGAELGDVYKSLDSLGVKWSLGEHYLDVLPGIPHVFLTPGMKKSLPQITRAKAAGARVSGEIGLFLERCRGKVAGITGSAGKTTTATLAGEMLRESAADRDGIYVGGNIGSVLIEQVDTITPDELVVLELSSFQLELVHKSPNVALVLNLHPNHLDVHDSYEQYVDAKSRIFAFQGPEDWCVLNLDDPVTEGFAKKCPGRVAGFTLDALKAHGILGRGDGSAVRMVAWLEGDALLAAIPGDGEAGGSLGHRQDFLVPGLHNVSNALGASLLSLLMGATPEGITRAIRSFKGVLHRIEFVRELNGVRYYNDSIATSPDRTEALLDAIRDPIVLILGGYDKGIPFDGLARRVAKRECAVVTLGASAEAIEDSLRKAGSTNPVARASSLQEAVAMAKEKARPGWVVALSPACASYDMFQNFEERGSLFRKMVMELDG